MCTHISHQLHITVHDRLPQTATQAVHPENSINGRTSYFTFTLFSPHKFVLYFFFSALCSDISFVYTDLNSFDVGGSSVSLPPQVSHVQEEPDDRFPLPHHHLLCPQLPGCLQQQRSDPNTQSSGVPLLSIGVCLMRCSVVKLAG